MYDIKANEMVITLWLTSQILEVKTISNVTVRDFGGMYRIEPSLLMTARAAPTCFSSSASRLQQIITIHIKHLHVRARVQIHYRWGVTVEPVVCAEVG